jgi:hypothetical protein
VKYSADMRRDGAAPQFWMSMLISLKDPTARARGSQPHAIKLPG